jgi:NAD(P)-dependent dehydrogenase (short-subunit alcohol dehydrogenase family)
VKPLAIITGASSGLGLESAKALAAKGFDLILLARGEKRLLAAAKDIQANNPEVSITAKMLDVSDFDQVKTFAASIDRPVDVLMNNAGLMGPDFKLSKYGIEIQMATNHLGHFVLTAGLWQQLNLAAHPRVISLSSVVHRRGNFDSSNLDTVRGAEEGKYNRWQRYADSKLACLWFARELHNRITAEGGQIKSIAAHPGWAVTGLQENFPHLLDPFAQTAKQGAQSQIYAAIGTDIDSGDFIGPNLELWGKPKKIKGSKLSHNADAIAALWRTSEELTGVKFLSKR